VAATFLASRVADPLALIDLGGLLFHADQWAAAAMILEAASSALPRSSPLCLRVESNLGMIYAALGESDRAQAHDNAYLALAVDSQDQWLRVIAHCQWIEHQTIWDPLRPDLAEHLRVIADWNAEAGRSDRFLRVWEATARAQMALAQERIVEAERLVQGMNAELQQYPELASEALMLGVLEARVLGARGNRARAFEHLVHLIHQHRQRPLVERLLAYQTISRLADYAGGDMAKMWQRMTIALYYGLGAEGWVSRLTQEWEVSLDEALLMVGDVAPSGH
jgi:tetratricopeptide (TPR) repeat protein